jgi:ABC-type transport system substrate-binding protein
MARPSKIVPMTAEALPEITDGGKTYTIRLKKGIRFARRRCVQGQLRELVAEDYAYSYKRLLDPRIHSPWS